MVLAQEKGILIQHMICNTSVQALEKSDSTLNTVFIQTRDRIEICCVLQLSRVYRLYLRICNECTF